MNNVRAILIGAAALLSAAIAHATTTSANGSVTASASVSASSVVVGSSITFYRGGSSNLTATNDPSTNPLTWTEATLWYPDGSYLVLGNEYAPNALTPNVISGASLPTKSIGHNSIQLRAVLKDYQYVDDWTSFNVTSSGGGNQ